MFIRFAVEFVICFYSLLFWRNINEEFNYLREHIELIIEIMMKFCMFIFHLVILSLSLYISVTEMYGDPVDSYVYVQLICFFGVLDYLIGEI
tara:strand:- start:788 stop:1063 length:276 start_codon:yes stop_codon:yes gene_type:complete